MSLFPRLSKRNQIRRTKRSIAIEPLEQRQLLAVTASYEDGILQLDADVGEEIVLSVADGLLKINGRNPDGGPVQATDIREVEVARESEAKSVNLEVLSEESFTSLESLVTHTAAGTPVDLRQVSQYAEAIIGADWRLDTGYSLTDVDQSLRAGTWWEEAKAHPLFKEFTDLGPEKLQALVDESLSGTGLPALDVGKLPWWEIADDVGSQRFAASTSESSHTQLGGGAAAASASSGCINTSTYSFTPVDGTEGGSVGFEDSYVEVSESDGFAELRVKGADGEYIDGYNVELETEDGSAIEPMDYCGGMETLGWDGNSEGRGYKVFIPITDDNISEGDEQFQVNLSFDGDFHPPDDPDGSEGEVSLGNSSATVRILDDDAALRIDDVTKAEGSGISPFTVSLSEPIDGDLTIQWTVNNTGITDPLATHPTDYNLISSSPIVIYQGQTSAVINVDWLEDLAVEPDEYFQIQLISASNSGTDGVSIAKEFGLGTIRDNDTQPEVSIQDASDVLEGDPGDDPRSLAFPVSLSQPYQQDITVFYTVNSQVSYIADPQDPEDWYPNSSDFTGGSGFIVIPANETSADIELGVVLDTLVEFDTYVHVELTGATNATLASSEEKATGLILDDDGRTDDDGHTVEERCDGACAVVNHGVDPHLGSVKADDQNGVGSDGEDNPHPIITVEAVVPPTPSPPGATEPYALFAAQATLSFGLLSSPGGGQLSLNNSTAVYFSETGLDSGEHLRFSVQGDATGIPTGTYDWRMRVTFYYGPESTDPSTINPYNPDLQGLQERHVTFYGSESIVNREGSPFGKRNWHNEIDYISEHFDFLTTGSAAGSTPSSDSGSSEGVTLVLGTGETIYFAAEREDDGPPPTVEEGGIVLPDLTPAKLVAPEGFFGKIRKHSAGGFEIIYPDGSYDVYSFNAGLAGFFQLGAFGRWMVTAKYDRFGNKTEFMYNDANADGNVDDVTGITDPFGVTTNFIYNGGKLTKIVDHVGRETLYEIDANNLLTRITTPDPDGAAGPEKAIVTAFEYNTTGNYLTKVRENAQLDTMGQITDAVDTTYVYNSGAIGRVGTIINDDSSSRQIKASQLFALGNPVGAVLPSPFFFATDEIQGEMTNELGEKTTYIVDRYGLMTSVTDNLGNTTEYDRNSDGQIDGVTLPDPDLTDLGNGPRQASSFTYIWDDDDNDINTGSLEQLIYPDSTSEIWEYDETFNQVTRYVDQEGRETLYTLGSNGRVDEIRQVMGVDDRTSSETDDSVWTFTYTQLGDQGHNDVLPIGLVRTITDPDGRITRYRYYGDSGSYNLPKLGLVYRVWEGYNTVDSAYKTFDYYSSRQLKTVTDELGRVTQYEWDDLDRLVKVTLPDPDDDELTDNQPVWEFNYCGCSGQLKTTTDPEGLVTTRHYDGRNRLQKVSVPNPEGGADLEWEYVYDAANRLTKIVDPLERETEYFYDDAGRLDRMLEPDVDGDPMTTNDRPEWIYTLDNLGLVTAIQDPEGRVTDQEYDIRLRLTKVILPQPELGQSRPEWEYEYSDANELRKIFDPLNHVTEYVYDDLGRLITVHLPDPNPGVSGDQPSLNYFYDKAGNLTSVIDGEQNETLYDYDARNRLKSVTLPEPDVGAPKPQMQYVYDDANQLDYMVDPEGRTTDYVYDNLGRVIEEWLDDPDGDPLTDDRPVTYFKYDKLGNLLFVEDALRNTGTSSFVTEYQYDGLHRLIKQIDADAGETVYNYDAVGNLESLTDPELNTTTWLYDGLNRVTSETNELSLQRSYVYDLVGNLQEYTDRRGLVTEYDYDNLDRLTEERWLDQGVTVHTINYGFDLANRMTSGGDTVASYSYAHDNLDRVTGVTSTLAGLTPAVVLAQEWDRANNRTQLGATVGGTADLVNDYVYDGINRLTQVTQQGVGGGNSVEEKRVDFFYNLAGQFDEIHRYADLAGTKSVIDSEFEYDLAGRLASITHGQGALSFAHEFDYDRANRITRHEYFSGGSLADAWDYVYDDRDQLTQVLDGLTVLEDYDYDANGNRDAVDGVAWQNTANNQLYRDATYEYEYDDEGNRTKRILLVAGQPTGATEEYTWDHRNRLTAVTFKTSPTGATTGTIIYAYDVFDRKVRRDEDNNGDGIADTREYYVYDGDDVLIDFYDADANGVLGQTIIARYLHGPGVDQILAQENVGASETYWHLGDHLQTTRDIVRYDEATSQTVAVEHLDYDAFGNVLTASTITRYMFTAREFDADTGLQYNRARWYDSKTGRWISEDPIGFAAGDANLIRYTGNQPTARTDPSGLDWLDAGADFSAGLGDTMSLGLGWLVRDKLIGINTVDYDSGGYYWGGWTGIAVDICSGGIFVKGSLKAAGRTAVREGAEFTAREVTEAGAREVTEQAVKEFAELLRTKSITELKEYTRGLPWQDLWGHGIDGAQTALRRLRSGESICPNSIEREALQAYDEMARRVLADPDKATEVGKRLQELRRAIIEELTRRGL